MVCNKVDFLYKRTTFASFLQHSVFFINSFEFLTTSLIHFFSIRLVQKSRKILVILGCHRSQPCPFSPLLEAPAQVGLYVVFGGLVLGCLGSDIGFTDFLHLIVEVFVRIVILLHHLFILIDGSCRSFDYILCIVQSDIDLLCNFIISLE